MLVGQRGHVVGGLGRAVGQRPAGGPERAGQLGQGHGLQHHRQHQLHHLGVHQVPELQYFVLGGVRVPAGSYTAQNFDESGGSWTMIKKFANDGTNGNGSTWTAVLGDVNSGSNTQISVVTSWAPTAGPGPTVLWDTLRVQ